MFYNKYMNINLRLLYLYLFAFVGLLITIIGCIRLVDLGLKTFVFTNAEKYYYSVPKIAPESGREFTPEEIQKQEADMQRDQEMSIKSNRQREAAGALAMIVIGLPLYLYHWHLIQKEKKK